MSDLEKLLREMPKPNPEVPRFKQSLRHDLRAIANQGGAAFFRQGFLVATALATAMAVFSILLIWRPDYAHQINAMVSGQDRPRGVEGQVSVAEQASWPEPLSAMAVSGMTPVTNPGSSISHSQWDQDFLRQVLAENLGREMDQIQPISDGQVYVLRQYRLGNGKRVLVYTEMSEDEDAAY